MAKKKKISIVYTGVHAGTLVHGLGVLKKGEAFTCENAEQTEIAQKLLATNNNFKKANEEEKQ